MALILIMLRISQICELKCISLVFCGQPKAEKKYECVWDKEISEKKVKPSTYFIYIYTYILICVYNTVA